MNSPAVDFSDIQGIVRFGYSPLTEASFFLLKIRDAKAAHAWLAIAPVSTAIERKTAPDTALQVAFTVDGLRALGMNEEVVEGFAPEFLSGMGQDSSRSRRLGDVGANSPKYWRWGSAEKLPHLVVMFYARPGQLQNWVQSAQNNHWKDGFESVDCLTTTNLHDKEPFGFADGVSQPAVDWERARVPGQDEIEYGNIVSLGEFLLGYPNEYGKYTDRPLLSADDPLAKLVPVAEDAPDKRDLGRNGSYVVLRQLEQDVRGFWRFANAHAHSGPRAREAFAESMVGRRMDGNPLEPLVPSPIPGVEKKVAEQNNFSYDEDSDGIRCPFGEHVRRTNPRNPDLPGRPPNIVSTLLRMLGLGNTEFRYDVEASTRFHRLLRRGREYGGPLLTPDQAIADASDTGEHGLHFICIVANITRQFEFVQNSWVRNTKFDALTDESDPLLGDRQPIAGCPFTNTFSIPQEHGVRDRAMNVPQFVTVRGGAYFFLPSLSSLRYLAALGESAAKKTS
jgi:deferrochelatase/peroxidase EfeB